MDCWLPLMSGFAYDNLTMMSRLFLGENEEGFILRGFHALLTLISPINNEDNISLIECYSIVARADHSSVYAGILSINKMLHIILHLRFCY